MKLSKTAAALFLAFCWIAANAQIKQKSVAITIDDLPAVTSINTGNAKREITRKIVSQIKKSGIPVIGFVNEGQLFTDGKRDEFKVNFLRQWLDAGIDLGNHTYSHADLSVMGLDEYEKDVVKGEIITKELLRQYKKKMIYFRHPYLKTGADMQTKNELDVFLKSRNYKIAPVTIAVSDWVFASAFDNAFLDKNEKLMKQISDAYIDFVLKEFEFSEKQSVKIFGYNIRHILLLHSNSINAENLGRLIRVLSERGYKFVSLENALRDPAYLTKDSYIGENGAAWLTRWAIARGKTDSFDTEPKLPEFITTAAQPKTN